MNDTSRNRFAAGLLAAFLVVFAVLAVDPHDRTTWALENILVGTAIGVLARHHRRFPLSRVSYGLVFVFLVLHEIGAHFTYERVPYEEWSARVFGTTPGAALGWTRNHYDRIVHFAFGLLLAYPVRELHRRIAGAKGFWSYFFVVESTMAASMAYELFEWAGVAMLGDAPAGQSFLGAQGDPWDAHKDMALATLGAAVAMLLTLAGNLALQPEFAREWRDSVAIDRAKPLGETAIAQMWHARRGRERRNRPRPRH
ncbi:MAG: DUF2238 domain-containing protein [Lautropia sp.]